MRLPSMLSAIWLTLGPVAAETMSSVYTSYDLNDPARCRQVEPPSEGFGGASLCEGHGGLFIYNADGDARSLEAYGRDPAKHCAARQTFFRFNNTHSTVEWRLAGGKPFATIVRWYVVTNDEGTQTKSWLP